MEGAPAQESKHSTDAAANEAPESAAEPPAVPEKAAASPGGAPRGPTEGAGGAPGRSAAAGAAPAASPEGLGSREGAPATGGALPRGEPSSEPSSARGKDPKGDVWVGHREDRRAVAPPRRGYTLRFHLIAASGAELLAATGEDQGARCIGLCIALLRSCL